MFKENVGNHIWKSALWLPATWNTHFSTPCKTFMKLDTGAAGVGASSEDVFVEGKFTPGKEKVRCKSIVNTISLLQPVG